jgi:quinol-cytochrome oxidoreductase complex cytochrome b subunit
MSVLPVPSFLDDIKEKGVRKAVLELVDESVERLTAGLNINDLREAIRGEAPTRRPNPRLTPHADAFWMHMRPSYYHQAMTGLYPTFRLGWLSTYFFLMEIISGLFLMIFYTPSPEAAYTNMLNILSNVPLGQFVRDMHRLGAEGMVLFVSLHMIRTYVTGSYKKPRQFTWFSGMALLLFTLFLSFTGYLLPWDQLAFWAVTIGTSMAEAAPPEIVGTNVNLLLRGAPDIGAGGLLRFYLAHVFLLPMLTTIFLGVHYYKVVLHGPSLPPREEEIGQDTAKRIPMERRVYFIPDILTSELMWFGAATFLMVVACVWFFHAPLEHHANPGVTPLHTTAPWYFLWLQGMLKLGDKIFWGLVIPTILLGLYFVWPYLDVTPSRRYAHRRFALSLSLLFITAMLFLTYMGTPKYGVDTAMDQEIAQKLAPVEGVGPLRAVPYDQFKAGTYCTNSLEKESKLAIREQIAPSLTAPRPDSFNNEITCAPIPESSPEFKAVLDEYERLIEEGQAKLPGAVGLLTVSDDQTVNVGATNLKRLDIKIIWNVPETNDKKEILRNDDGTPKLKMVTMEVADTNPDGTPKLTDSGLPVMKTITVPAVTSSGKTIFVNKASEYFNYGG